MSLLAQIPGYAEAVNAELVNRELAFMPAPMPICGLPIRHLNPRHQMILVRCRNAFVCGGLVQPKDVAFFLWALSPEYVMNDTEKRDAYIRERVARLNFRKVSKEILAYMQQVMQDMPQGEGVDQKLYTAPVASLVDLLALEYGWSDEAILEMPLARIFQYARRIQARHQPRVPLFNRSDGVIAQWQRALGGRN